MGLAKRVIPTLLCRHRLLVKGRGFAADRVVGHLLQGARVHQGRGVDELLILDVAATQEGTGPDFALIEKLTAECLMPLTLGGGVKSVDHVTKMLRAGADKVAICTAFVDLPEMKVISERYGKQVLVAAIDVKHEPHICGHQVYFRCGKDTTAGHFDPVKWAKICADFAGEILLTSIDRDGTMEGYDIDLIRSVSAAVNIPVIASGGCKDYQDMYDAILAGASAVAAGALFQFTSHTPAGAAMYLNECGVEVRLCG